MFYKGDIYQVEELIIPKIHDPSSGLEKDYFSWKTSSSKPKPCTKRRCQAILKKAGFAVAEPGKTPGESEAAPAGPGATTGSCDCCGSCPAAQAASKEPPRKRQLPLRARCDTSAAQSSDTLECVVLYATSSCAVAVRDGRRMRRCSACRAFYV